MEVSRNMKILAKLASMNKEAQGNPMLVSSLIGAGAGGLAGDLTSQLLWKKPTKTQRILSALVGAGLGAGTGAAVTGSFGHKAVQNLPARLQSMYQNTVGTLSGKLPSKEDFASMSPTAKAMYGSTNTGDKTADRLGAVVGGLKKTIVGPNDEGAVIANVLGIPAALISAYKGGTGTVQALSRQGRRMALIQALKSKDSGSQQAAADRLKAFTFLSNPVTNIGKALFQMSPNLRLFLHKRRVKDVLKQVHDKNTAAIANKTNLISPQARSVTYRLTRSSIDPRLRGYHQARNQRLNSPLEAVFGLSQRRANRIFDRTNLGVGLSSQELAKLKNSIIKRPVGKLKSAAGLLGALLSGAAAYGGVGFGVNTAFGNNARYQQALTNLQNAYK